MDAPAVAKFALLLACIGIAGFGIGRRTATGTSLGIASVVAGGLLLFRCAAIWDARMGWLACGAAWIAVVRWAFRKPLTPFGEKSPPLLFAIILIAAVSRLVLVWNWALPAGHDPAFHLLLVSRIGETHRAITNWQPYEPIALNYPIAPHILLAQISEVTNLPPERLFSLCIALLSTLITALTYRLGRAVGLPASASLAGTALFGLGTWLGSLGYLHWGGLGNLVGMTCLLPALTLLAASSLTRLRATLLAVLIAGAATAHHHVMLTSALVSGAVLVGTRRRDAVPAVVAGALLSSVSWAPLLLRFQSIGKTEVGSYTEDAPVPFWLAENMGWGLTGALIATCILLAIRARLRDRPAWPINRVGTTALLALIILWAACDWGVRAFAHASGQAPFTILIPSRFLTDAMPFLALLAGWGLSEMVPKGWQAKVRAVVLSVLTLGLCMPLAGRYAELWAWHHRGRYWLAAGRWVQQHTEQAGTVIDNSLTVDPDMRPWLTYLTRRRTTWTYIPASEPLADLPDEDRLGRAAVVLDLRLARWVRPGVHEVLHVAGEGPEAIAVSRVRWRNPGGGGPASPASPAALSPPTP